MVIFISTPKTENTSKNFVVCPSVKLLKILSTEYAVNDTGPASTSWVWLMVSRRRKEAHCGPLTRHHSEIKLHLCVLLKTHIFAFNFCGISLKHILNLFR